MAGRGRIRMVINLPPLAVVAFKWEEPAQRHRSQAEKPEPSKQIN